MDDPLQANSRAKQAAADRLGRPFRTLRDVLQDIGDLHRRHCKNLAAGSQNCSDPRQRALLEYLRDREAEQFGAIQRLLTEPDDVLQSRVQNPPTAALGAASLREEPAPDFDGEVLRYRQRDRALIQAYSQLAANAEPRAERLFSSLLAMRHRTQSRLREALLDA